MTLALSGAVSSLDGPPPRPSLTPLSSMVIAKGDFMSKRPLTSLLRLFGVVVIGCVLLVPTVAQGQATIKVNDNISLRFGTLIQGWIDSTQDPATKSHANSIFLRRM